MFSILIADDDPDVQELLQIALDAPDFRLTAVNNGQAAIDSFKHARPDLVILDIQMPEKTGTEACMWIKEHTKNSFVPVILLTSQKETQQKVHGLSVGADDYVTKPFALPELEARVRAMLRIKTLTEELQATKDLLADREKQLVAAQVAGAAAHELGQPLTSVLLNCDILTRVDATSISFAKSLNTIIEQCQRMRQILSSLSRINGYKTKPYVGDMQILDIGN